MGQVDRLDNQKIREDSNLPKEVPDSIKQILEQIIEIDNKNRALIKAELDESELELNNIKAELRKMREGRRQGENYGYEYGSYKEEGVFFDTKE